MATKDKKDTEHGMVGRLATAGEDATNRLFEALGKNVRLTDALTRATAARGKLDTASKAALTQLGLAPVEEVKDLRKQVERLEKRLAKLETAGGPTSAKRSSTKKTPSAKRGTRRADSTKKDERAVSPSAGRAIGGASARGAGPGGTSAA